MKVYPILFSPQMVKAILAGKKTQTRRVMRPQPIGIFADYQTDLGYPASLDHFWAGFWLSNNRDGSPGYYKCPFGPPGSLLWVRETWRPSRDPDCIVYRAGDAKRKPFKAVCGSYDGKWKPSIFMPRWASRITLKIQNIRVERLQSISQKDAIAEGIGQDTKSPIECFADLWNSINARRGYSWESNPWVWVISFEAIVKNIEAVLGELNNSRI